MKTIQTAITAMIAFLLILIPSSCTRNQVSVLDMTILMDNTDTFNRISYDEVRSIFEFDRFLWYEHNLKIRELSDVEQGISSEIHLPKCNTNEQIENNRKRQIQRFLAQTESMLAKDEFQSSDKTESHIYYGVAQELNRLASQSSATNRVAIINSDMHEHTSLFSVYNDQDSTLLMDHPDSVIRIFNNALELEDLTGIQVVIVHRANANTNETFSHMARLYQMMLGLKGAQVHIVGSFNPSDLNYKMP